MGYSFKPGRGPSLGGAVSGLIAAVFGVLWTVGVIAMFRLASSHDMGPPAAVVVLFIGGGVLFTVLGIGAAVYHFYNATSRDRMSLFDIIRRGDESDPIARALGHERGSARESAPAPDLDPRGKASRFCPYCGQAVESDFRFCPACGREQ